MGLAGLSALLVRRMIGSGVLDIPVERSSHDRPTPKGGGVGIVAAFAVGLTVAWAAGLVPHAGVRVTCLLAAGLLMAAVSWADDIGQFGFRTKLAAQFASAAILIGGGYTITSVGPVHLGPFGAPVTLAWMLVAINAVNFIDGLNGLASGCTLIAALAIASVSRHAGDPLPVAAMLSVAAGIAGFLPFNYPKARIFMGDVGSQFCGLALAAMAGPSGRWPHHPWAVLLVPLAIAPILADVAFTLVRRFRAGERVTQAHRGHLYQIANRLGYAAAQVTAAFWALTLSCSVFATIAANGSWPVAAAAVAAASLPLAAAAALVVRAARRAGLLAAPFSPSA